MGNLFDQLAKKIGLRALAASGRTEVEHEILSHAHRVDLCHEPDPTREAERARLGLLGRLASVLCLIEIFSSAPGEEKIVDVIGKLVAFRQERRRGADERGQEKPFLWIITAGRPTSALTALGAAPASGWPRGVYLSPGDAGDPALGGGLLRVGIVVASELPRERSTLLVRIMAGGTGLPAALAELSELPADACERTVASMDVLELRRALGGRAQRTVEEEEFIVGTQNIIEELRDEGRKLGVVEGEVRALLTALRVRGIAVSEAARERILAVKDVDRLERWLERAVVATRLDEVLDDPS